LQSPERLLLVETTHSASEIAAILKKAGYNAHEMN
jgi:hypothetical protein